MHFSQSLSKIGVVAGKMPQRNIPNFKRLRGGSPIICTENGKKNVPHQSANEY